jgi:hypothetical protein
MEPSIVLFRRKHTRTWQDAIAFASALLKQLARPVFTHVGIAYHDFDGVPSVQCVDGIYVHHGAMTYTDKTCLDEEYGDSVFVFWRGDIRRPFAGQKFLTCVQFVKFVLCINDEPGIQTPDELYVYLLTHGGEEL